MTGPIAADPDNQPLAVLVDIDGTLVDSVYHHTLAWHRAMKDHGVHVPAWVLHRHIGMGGDQLIDAVAGRGVEDRLGDRIRESETLRYEELMEEIQPLPGARELLVTLKEAGFRLTLASSAKEQEVAHYLDLLMATDLVDDLTTAGDVDRTKPAPDMVRQALSGVGGPPGIMLGDATWDCIAATAAGIPTVGVLTGGFSDAELRTAGAVTVFEDLDAVTAHLVALRAPSPSSKIWTL